MSPGELIIFRTLASELQKTRDQKSNVCHRGIIQGNKHQLEVRKFCMPGGVPECHQLSLVFLPVHALQL
nr:hypothetical protein CFP56_20820 [Quercus suber]